MFEFFLWRAIGSKWYNTVMAMYLNEGASLYAESVNSEIHVDKSLLIRATNRRIRTSDKYICLSRPRRFGKSMAAHMLMAYYTRGADSRELFKDKKIYADPTFETHFGKYNVIHLSMTDFVAGGVDAMEDDLLSTLKREILQEVDALRRTDETYASTPFAFSRPDSLVRVLQDFFAWSGIPYIFIIDEWDCFMRETTADEAAQRAYLDFLKVLLKDRAYVGLAYMTGILPVKKYGEQSALNMFTEFSMEDQMDFAEFAGFTRDETEALCRRYGIDPARTETWYDGYNVNGISVFNPRSIVQLCQRRRFASYWTKTETYESLKNYILLDLDGLKSKVERLIAGERVPVNTARFQNDMTHFKYADDILALMIHFGYLTYDVDACTCWIPNLEVQGEFVNCIEDEASWTPIFNAIRDAERCLQALLAGDAATVAELVERCHQQNTSLIRYNDENALACVVTLAFYTARRHYVLVRELPSGKGYADLAFLPRQGENLPAVVIELKAEGTASLALEQIRRRDYPAALRDFSGEILLVGINYQSDPAQSTYKHHTCQIETWIK